MTDSPVKNKFFTIYNIVLLIAVTALLLANIFLLYRNREDASLQHALLAKYESLDKKIHGISERIELTGPKVTSLENKIGETIASLDIYENRLIKLETRTVEGQDRNVKILMNLNGVRKSLGDGEDFSNYLDSLERLCATDAKLRAMLSELRGYDTTDLVPNHIEDIFNDEKTKVGKRLAAEETPTNLTLKTRIIKFLETNIKITKKDSSASKNYEFNVLIDRATRSIARGKYTEFMALVQQNEKFADLFRETSKIVSKRIELNKLVDNLFEMIYYVR
ncbi:MAG: hypothetical protein LBI70_03730 [Rickettsiales bacterium]|jgi:hypothetical protein|nr:hypothetical protein [Rickettsiales bacterium]